MELAAQPIVTPKARPVLRPWQAEQALTWAIGFVPASYLALSGGGYDIVVRSEVGLIVWWGLFLAVLVGVLPRTRWTWAGWTAAGLLTGFFAWSWIASGWSQNQGNTLAEVARLGTYLGVFALGLCLVTRANVSALLNGLACATLLVAALACLSKMEPSWFQPDKAKPFYYTGRLSFPFDYADGVGEFAALGLPLLLYTATGARTLAARAGAAAGLPVVVLCLALTASRGGILAAAAGLIAFFALVPDRLPRLAIALAAAIASAVPVFVLLRGAGRHTDLLANASTTQRHTLLSVTLLSCAGAFALALALGLLLRHAARPRWLRFSRRQALAVTALMVAAVVAAIIALAAGGTVHHLWQDFKKPNPPASGTLEGRLLSVSGSHRYQYWQAGMNAFHAHPWKGIGPGAYQYYWAEHNTLSEYVVNAHSLYIESLAETGIIGLTLIGGFVVFVLVGGSARALLASPARRLALATAVAGFAGFAAAASFDWVWQLGGVAIVGLLLAAVAVSGLWDRERIGPGQRLLAIRLATAVTAVVALWAIIVPLGSTVAIRSSQNAAANGDYSAALRYANTAQALDPSAENPRLQRALLLELLGHYVEADQIVGQAIARGPTDSSTWAISSRLAIESGHPRRALADWRQARSLDPTNPIFHQ